MTIWRLALKELSYRKLNSGLGLTAVAVAVATVAAGAVLLRAHDLHTRQLLQRKQEQTQQRMQALEIKIRDAMRRLGFNITILPQDQDLSDWHASSYAAKYMPESFIDKLRQADIMTVEELVPILRQRCEWPETKWTVIVLGVGAPIHPPRQDAGRPLIERPAPGTVVLGYEVHRGLKLKTGDKIKLKGREFTVARCRRETGSKDDVALALDLGDAQELFAKRGYINEIRAVEARCAWADLAQVRREIATLLPGTTVIEHASKAITLAEARAMVGREAAAALARERQARALLRSQRADFLAVLAPLVVLACGLWIALLASRNVRSRRLEIAVWATLGLPPRRVAMIFLVKWAVVGLGGGLLGFALAAGLATRMKAAAPLASIVSPSLLVLAVTLALGLTVVASWIPAVVAARHDPAVGLRGT